MVRQLEIIRLEKTEEGILGVLLIDSRIFCYTLEHPTKELRSGTYPAVFEYSPKFDRELYELKVTGDREEIKFHVGNTMDDSTGCILLGRDVGQIYGKRAILSSDDTIDRFHKELDRAFAQVTLLDLTGL